MAIYGIPILVIALSIPLILNLIPPNHYYGVRTEKTYSSTDLWYAGNHIGGVTIGVAALVALGVAFLLRGRASELVIHVSVVGVVLVGVITTLDGVLTAVRS